MLLEAIGQSLGNDPYDSHGVGAIGQADHLNGVKATLDGERRADSAKRNHKR